MAGGLFAVYRDTTAVQPSQPTSRRAREVSSNSSSSTNNRKKDGFAVFRDNGRSVNGLQEKENMDPLSKSGKKAGLSGKGKKVHSDSGDCTGVSSKGKLVMGERVVKRSSKSTTVSMNGICTGTLRTRELPPLPPLESDPTEEHPVQPSSTSTPEVPSIVEIPRADSPLPSSVPLQSVDSPASNVDSGYGKVSDGDLELEGGIDLDDESDMSLEVDATELNRRARALTESPLAEITQAFTGLGRFSNAAPASPSPTLNRPVPSLRKRSSPLKSVSALPPRLRPYSTTATTRKIKPGQTTAEPPRTAPSRSLRF
ncbi:hypothetical protein JCM3765_000623 [Sporobolomyces pararoseus]